MLIAGSAWAVPLVEPSPLVPMQVCREEPTAAPPPVAAPRVSIQPRNDIKAATPRSHLPNATALIASGALFLGAGTAMKVPAPLYWEIDPRADPFSGASTLRAGLSTATHSTQHVVLGSVGTVLQAVGVGLIQRGAAVRTGR